MPGKKWKVMATNDQRNILRRRSSALGGGTADTPVEALAPRTSTSEYAELKGIVKRQGLLDKQPAYYARTILVTSGMLAVSGVLLLITDNIWLQILNAVYLAFVFTQIAFIGHDLGHRQIFRSERKSALLGLVVANLILGMSRGWWVDKHNRHHANPNHDDLDPDVDIPVLAFSEEQALSKRGLRGSRSNTKRTYSSHSCCWKHFTCGSTASISCSRRKQSTSWPKYCS